MKKTVIALALVAASVSAMAGNVTNFVSIEGKIVGNVVDVSAVDFDSRTKTFEKMVPIDLTLGVINPQTGEKYEICPVFTLYREDSKTLLTLEKCWPVENAKAPITVKLDFVSKVKSEVTR